MNATPRRRKEPAKLFFAYRGAFDFGELSRAASLREFFAFLQKDHFKETPPICDKLQIKASAKPQITVRRNSASLVTIGDKVSAEMRRSRRASPKKTLAK
ncbi:hypothetical protein EDS67_06605 [candidate division KSB1 bacterium]|nr:MAG: hypothetical protein EDS67_06605 [candidate division KSB1 bacterium]MBC6951276.1 hypothetical protein [candidate division KSB1 bacterium]MCE7941258.1 hypothetical protein [Chlorobi bacterium CHB1]MDL1878894.1 hypothetical protein [Cytophagia bacterium CHB2]